MDAGRTLRQARRRAGLTQRELAHQAGVRQPSVARIESGAVVPRLDTFVRLLRACGEELHAGARLTQGVDVTLIDGLLDRTPAARAAYMADASRKMTTLRERIRRR
jgi:predicted transcriptional regulator